MRGTWFEPPAILCACVCVQTPYKNALWPPVPSFEVLKASSSVRQYMSSVDPELRTSVLARASSYLVVIQCPTVFSSFPTHHHNRTSAVETALLISPTFHFYHSPKHIHPDDGGSTFPRNVDILLQNFTASRPRRYY